MTSRITVFAAFLAALAACPAPPAPDTGPALDRVTVAPYGTWRSHITPGLVTSRGRSFGSPLLLAADGRRAYWVEGRPEEGGRAVLVQWTEGRGVEDLTGAPFNVRTAVHEYGGGAFVVAGEMIVFSNAGDGRLYRLQRGGQPAPLTPRAELRYADLHLQGGRLIAVREDHRVQGKEAVNTLVAIDLDRGGEGAVLASGKDFYASPRPSPDGKQLAWLSWSHPNMPWDGTELWMGGANGEQARQVAGGPRESVYQPEWSPGGVLHFVSDRSGWWNLYRLGEGDRAEPLKPMQAELGLPQWVFGLSSYAFSGEREIICSYTRDGVGRLARLDAASGKLTPIRTPYSLIVNVRAAAGRVLYEGGSPTLPLSVVRHDPAGKVEVLREGMALDLAPDEIAQPRPISFPTTGGATAHAFFYRPVNPDFRGPAGERPPLLVISHGGPTGASRGILRAGIQYWTSRGFAVLDVNYRGSTGYGRPYRDALKGRWGVVDVDDCVNGARHLVARGEVDGKRLVIRGWSAGGYTTLCALTFRRLFSAGASYYGLSDLEPFTKHTHKFESRYMDQLVAPYPARRDVYRARSPLHHLDGLRVPVIFFQGLDDPIVAPVQAEAMVAALRRKGVPVAYVPFPGEKHGFRRAENIQRALEAELYFYGQVLGFEPAGRPRAVKIHNKKR